MPVLTTVCVCFSMTDNMHLQPVDNRVSRKRLRAGAGYLKCVIYVHSHGNVLLYNVRRTGLTHFERADCIHLTVGQSQPTHVSFCGKHDILLYNIILSATT